MCYILTSDTFISQHRVALFLLTLNLIFPSSFLPSKVGNLTFLHIVPQLPTHLTYPYPFVDTVSSQNLIIQLFYLYHEHKIHGPIIQVINSKNSWGPNRKWLSNRQWSIYLCSNFCSSATLSMPITPNVVCSCAVIFCDTTSNSYWKF